jgi:DNA topoisomerase I
MTKKKRTRGTPSTALITDSHVSAKAAGLRYVTDASPSIRRNRVGKGFTYLTNDGTQLRDRHELQRITSLRIPPA